MNSIQNQIINPVQDGGAPIFVSDLLQVQENSKNGYRSFFEKLVSNTGNITFAGGSSAKYGCWIIEPTITEVTPSEHNVGAGYFYADGELVYFGGGTFNLNGTGTSGNFLLICVDEITSKNSRVFKDGFSKEFEISYSAKAYLTSYNPVGIVPPSGANLLKQFVRLSKSSALPTVKDALGVTTLESRVTTLESAGTVTATGWTTITLPSGMTGTLRYRRDLANNIHLRGSVTVADTGTFESKTVGTLPVGFRPTEFLSILCATYSGSGIPQGVNIGNNGVISIAVIPSSSTFLRFDGVCFPSV